MLSHLKRGIVHCAFGLAVLAAALPAPALAANGEAGGEPHTGTELVLRAMSLLGVNYKFGGTSPDTGLDCSGLVRHVFREAVGMVLPRRAEEMSREGESIDTSQLRPGDLVFFNTLRRTFSHVGIYIGNDQFVHAPSRGGGVRVEMMSKQYWSQRFNGARRLLAQGLGFESSVSASQPASQASLQATGMSSSLPLTGALLPRSPADLLQAAPLNPN